MTIQDILDQLRISKGAFYHYFNSKADVLEALLERMVVEQVEPQLLATVHDPHLSALEKLQCYFDIAVRWKTAKKSLIMELVKVWYSDENALTRQKMQSKMFKYVTPLFVEIIEQGVREGVFTTRFPEHASHVNIHLIQSLGDTFAEMLLMEHAKQDNSLPRAEALIAAYNDALERVLGAPQGSIHLMDLQALKEWFSPSKSSNRLAKGTSPSAGDSGIHWSLDA